LGALQREGLLENLCGLAGCSAGAMSGAAIASGSQVFEKSSETLKLHSDMERLVTLGDRRWQVLDPGVGFGLLKGHGVEAEMSNLYASSFDQLCTPFACTATSLSSMQTVVLNHGALPAAVRASMTVPLLFQPGQHEDKRFLVDGGIWDWSGSKGLSGLPKQPDRSLHIIVNRKMPFLSHFERVVPPSKFGAPRSEVITLRLNNPPNLFLGEASFQSFGEAIVVTAASVTQILDCPLQAGDEAGHFIIDVDVNWVSKPCCTYCERRKTE